MCFEKKQRYERILCQVDSLLFHKQTPCPCTFRCACMRTTHVGRVRKGKGWPSHADLSQSMFSAFRISRCMEEMANYEWHKLLSGNAIGSFRWASTRSLRLQPRPPRGSPAPSSSPDPRSRSQIAATRKHCFHSISMMTTLLLHGSHRCWKTKACGCSCPFGFAPSRPAHLWNAMPPTLTDARPFEPGWVMEKLFLRG